MTIEFKPWPKIPRLENEQYFYTEKIDGTNACVIVSFEEADSNTLYTELTEVGPMSIWAQSRTKFITPDQDNYGFAKWVVENSKELLKLGVGYHYGEWWGKGVQRGYDLNEKRFSLFNTGRWNDENKPSCCHVVPLIPANSWDEARNYLVRNGSLAAPGYKNPEGLIMYTYSSKTYHKIIINK